MGITFSVFVATSVDGFIARKNGDLDWLPGSDGEPASEDHGFVDFLASIDTLVMGRKTYEKVMTFEDWPYRCKRVIVLSSRFPRNGEGLGEGAEGISASPVELARQLAASSAARVYVDGGETIQGFLNAGLITDMTITRIPVLLGEGVPLFGPLAGDIRLLHQSTRTWESGLVQSKYLVEDAARAHVAR